MDSYAQHLRAAQMQIATLEHHLEAQRDAIDSANREKCKEIEKNSHLLSILDEKERALQLLAYELREVKPEKERALKRCKDLEKRVNDLQLDLEIKSRLIQEESEDAAAKLTLAENHKAAEMRIEKQLGEINRLTKEIGLYRQNMMIQDRVLEKHRANERALNLRIDALSEDLASAKRRAGGIEQVRQCLGLLSSAPKDIVEAIEKLRSGQSVSEAPNSQEWAATKRELTRLKKKCRSLQSLTEMRKTGTRQGLRSGRSYNLTM